MATIKKLLHKGIHFTQIGASLLFSYYFFGVYVNVFDLSQSSFQMNGWSIRMDEKICIHQNKSSVMKVNDILNWVCAMSIMPETFIMIFFFFNVGMRSAHFANRN